MDMKKLIPAHIEIRGKWYYDTKRYKWIHSDILESYLNKVYPYMDEYKDPDNTTFTDRNYGIK